MAEKTEDLCKISLKPPSKTISSIVCTLKFPNVFILPQYFDTFNIYSPTFEFANTTWRFRLSPDNDEADIPRSCNILLLRSNFEKSRQKLFVTIVVLDSDDAVHRRFDDLCIFEGDDDKSENIGCFYDSEPTFDRRDNLTVIVQLISTETNFFDVDDQIPLDFRRGKSLSQDFQNVFLNGEDHNLTFDVCGTEFKVHRDILKARSEVFQSMLNHDMLEKKSDIISVPDCDPQAFEQFLYYVYSGEVKALNESNMFGLYYTADKYNFSRLKEECSEFIKNSISEKNICQVIELASKHDDEDLLDCTLRYFNHKADVIWPSDMWQSFMKERYVLANKFIAKSFEKSKSKKAKRLRTS